MTMRSEGIEGLAGRPADALPLARPRRSEDDRVDLRGLVRVLRRRATSILVVTAVALALAVAFLALATPLYTATVQILIDPRDRHVLQTEVTPTGVGGDASLVESQVRLITSDAVLRRVVASEHLASDIEFGAAPAASLSSRLRALIGLSHSQDATAVDPELRALLALQRRVTVRRAERTYIMEVRVNSADARKAARLADAIAAAYFVDQAEADQSTTRRATDALTSRLDQLRDNLRAAENRAQDFRNANNIVGSQGTLVGEQQLSELNQRLVLARARASEVQARYDQVQRVLRSGGDPGSIPDALTSNVIQSLRTQSAEISRRESELENQLGPRHPSVLDQRAQAQNVRRLISEELKRIADASRNELDAANANERTLAKELDRLSQSNMATNQAMIRLRELEREVDASRQLYEAFLTRAKQTSEQERIETPSARIIAPAIVPIEPSFPPRLLVIALALGGGLAVGVSLALIREHFDDSFHSAAQLRRIAGLDLLAAVPMVGPARRFLPSLAKEGLDFDVIDRPGSPLGSATRLLRNELRDAPGRAGERLALIVSAEQGEGKTTIALNLALAAAASGERVLLVDADMARRALSRRIAPDAKAGLFEVLNGELPLADALVRDPRSGLEALPLAPKSVAGERPSRAQLAMLKDAVARNFDYVIFDGGPLLDDFASRSIGEIVDQIVMVVRAGGTRREAVTEAIEILRMPRTKLVGAVLNMADPKALTRYEFE